MIFFETAGQRVIFLLLLGAGFAAGMLYDALGLLRKKAPGWIKAALDGLWCLFAVGACAFALLMGGEGRLRLYALLGLCCGGGMYCLGLRAAMEWIGRRLKGR